MKRICFVTLFIASIIFAFAQDIKPDNVTEPSWVYLKRAENLKDQGDYSTAIIEARKAKVAFFNERVAEYYEKMKQIHTDKTDYEIKKIVNGKKEELLKDDTFPAYHELVGDLYVLTGFLEEADDEYHIALKAKPYFDYPQKELEIKYKLADVYEKNLDFDLADVVNREICQDFFASKDQEFWARLKHNIKTDPSLSHVFRIYRLEGIEYLRALYKIGRHSALLQRKDDSLFYLSVATIVWMTNCCDLVKRNVYDFSYAGPTDFIAVLKDISEYQYVTDETIIEEILFYIAYAYHIDNNFKIRNNYIELAETFAQNSSKRNKIAILCETLRRNDNHILSYEEIF